VTTSQVAASNASKAAAASQIQRRGACPETSRRSASCQRWKNAHRPDLMGADGESVAVAVAVVRTTRVGLPRRDGVRGCSAGVGPERDSASGAAGAAWAVCDAWALAAFAACACATCASACVAQCALRCGV